MKSKPPKLAEKILSRLQYDDVWKTTLGDFEEYYSYKAEKDGVAVANRWYWLQVIQYAPSKLIHKYYWGLEMFKNYLKIAYRNIQKNKSYSFINIFGLGVGIASFLLIGMYIVHEISYDSFHEDSDRIYRIVREAPDEIYLGSSWFGVNPMPLSIALADEFEGVEHSTAFNESEALLKVGQNTFYEFGINTDPEFFNVFSINWIIGDPTTSFRNPESIIMTQSLSEKYFGKENPLGKTVFFNSEDDEPMDRVVAGVIEDLPTNTQLEFDFIIPSFSKDDYERESTYWFNNNQYSYIKLLPGTNPNDLVPLISETINPNLLADPYYGNSPEKLPNFKLIPASEVHLSSSDINFNPGKIGDIKYIYMLSAIAFVILIIACVNYMNLATARSMSRAKEVGVRKVNGAFRSNIMMQFSAEAVIFSSIGIIFAFALVYMLLPAFSGLVDRSFDTSIFLSLPFWLALIGSGLIVGVISGSYPALYMSALHPIRIFKNQIKGGSGNRRLRNMLVISQFAITNILIVSSIVIIKQMDYIQSRDSGFDRDQILAVTITDPEVMNHYAALESLFESQSNILEVSSARKLPSEIRSQTSGVSWEGKAEDEILRVYHDRVNIDYVELLGIDVIAGRTFNHEMDTDTSNHLIINKTMAEQIGWTPEEAVGKDFTFWRRDAKIIGVIDDFNFLSYHFSMAPLMLRYENIVDRAELLLKVNPQNLQETISFVDNEIKKLSPNYPIEYAFLDDAFNNQYQNELTLGKILNYFTVLALVIACLGLFGLASFMMEQRTKEIGIRKVLGANLFQILSLLNKDFIRLVGISLLISIPVGWYLTSNWLKDFAFRIELGVGVFLASSVIAIIIALITVSFKSIQTAKANPVDSLKGE